MPHKPSNLTQFWQELRRRKVVRVITVYAAAAFAILELLSIIVDPLNLPEWTLTFAIVFLCIGFIIAVILSWIYDIGPEGIEKTVPVHQLKEEEKAVASNSWKIASYIGFVVIVALIVLNVVPRNRDSKNLPILEKSIAILPFNNLSEEEGNEHFVDGLVEDLLSRISVIDELKVISRTSSDVYRERGVKSVPEIAGELGVSYIMEGSVQRYGNKARITVQLIDAINDDHIWAENYDRDIVDVFQTQSEIAMQIASELNAILTSKQESQLQESKTKNVKAFELYQMGRFYWNKRTGEGFQISIRYFKQAIDEDPGYGLAYAGLADTYNLMALQGWIDKQQGRDSAEGLALKALKLDQNLAEAYTVLGSIYDYVDWDWDKAEKAFARALELNPNYATAHHYYSEHLSILGQHEEARIQIDKALELDPLSFVIRYVSVKLYYNQGRFDEALLDFQKMSELQEDHPWLERYDFKLYYQLGDKEKAFEVLWKRMTAPPVVHDLDSVKKIYDESGLKGVIEYDNEVIIEVSEGGEGHYFYLAGTYGMIGEDEKAMDWLERAFKVNKISPEISYNIHFKNLHDNPRYIAILEQMGLPPQ
jgi:TolB-like protein/lipoprotein NlpI